MINRKDSPQPLAGPVESEEVVGVRPAFEPPLLEPVNSPTFELAPLPEPVNSPIIGPGPTVIFIDPGADALEAELATFRQNEDTETHERMQRYYDRQHPEQYRIRSAHSDEGRAVKPPFPARFCPVCGRTKCLAGCTGKATRL